MKKLIIIAIVAWLYLPVASYAWDVIGDITVHDVKYREVRRDSIGNVWVSLQADVTNYGPNGTVFVDLVAKDSNGYEIDNSLVSARLDTRENKMLTTLKPVRNSIYANIREWAVKSVRRY